jgi:hypothetical protein
MSFKACQRCGKKIQLWDDSYQVSVDTEGFYRSYYLCAACANGFVRIVKDYTGEPAKDPLNEPSCL